MTNFIMSNWITIAIVLMVLFYVGYLIYTGQFKVRALSLMVVMPDLYNNEQGEQKMDAVLKIIYTKLPPWLKWFITQAQLKKILQKLYDTCWEYLNSNRVDDVKIYKKE